MAKRICSIEGCDREAYTRGWCKAHYARERRHGDPLGGKRSIQPGEVFSRLTVVAERGRANGERTYNCICVCGESRVVLGSNLRTGHTRSCGCLKRDLTKRRNSVSRRVHGHTTLPSPTYASWQAMRTRCLNPNASNWRWYGGRGISICRRWSDSFEAFLADMGERPPDMTIDRVDPNGNYEPANCRWATPSEQRRNQVAR